MFKSVSIAFLHSRKVIMPNYLLWGEMFLVSGGFKPFPRVAICAGFAAVLGRLRAFGIRSTAPAKGASFLFLRKLSAHDPAFSAI
jgi:hypothetical protein